METVEANLFDCDASGRLSWNIFRIKYSQAKAAVSIDQRKLTRKFLEPFWEFANATTASCR